MLIGPGKTAQKTVAALRFQASQPDRRPDESAHRRLRLGSPVVAEGRLDFAERSEVVLAGRPALLGSESRASSFAGFTLWTESSTSHHRWHGDMQGTGQ